MPQPKLDQATLDQLKQVGAISDETYNQFAAPPPAEPQFVPQGQDYRVVHEFGDDMPGQIVQDPAGKSWFAPAYGPNAGQLVDIGQGVADINEVRQFMQGPQAPQSMPVQQTVPMQHPVQQAPMPQAEPIPVATAPQEPPGTEREKRRLMLLEKAMGRA